MSSLSEQINRFRWSILDWREGLTLTAGDAETFDKIFEGWEAAAKALERERAATRDELATAQGIACDIEQELAALGELTHKVTAYTARLRERPALKGV